MNTSGKLLGLNDSRNGQLLGCWIDGATPRNEAERISKLKELMVAVIELCHGDASEKWKHTFVEMCNPTSEEFESVDSLDELERDIIDNIGSILPEELEIVCEAGDVIVCKSSEVDL